jgi:hypothetical protein
MHDSGAIAPRERECVSHSVIARTMATKQPALARETPDCFASLARTVSAALICLVVMFLAGPTMLCSFHDLIGRP